MAELVVPPKRMPTSTLLNTLLLEIETESAFVKMPTKEFTIVLLDIEPAAPESASIPGSPATIQLLVIVAVLPAPRDIPQLPALAFRSFDFIVALSSEEFAPAVSRMMPTRS